MTQETHTNGPWTIHPTDFSDGRKEIYEGNSLIASVLPGHSQGFTIPRGTQLKNAKLIAASPEMANALLHIHKIFRLDAKTNANIEDALKKAGILE